MEIPELTDDAVVELAREGGVAFMPKLARAAQNCAVDLIDCSASARGRHSPAEPDRRYASGTDGIAGSRRPALLSHTDHLDTA